MGSTTSIQNGVKGREHNETKLKKQREGRDLRFILLSTNDDSDELWESILWSYTLHCLCNDRTALLAKRICDDDELTELRANPDCYYINEDPDCMYALIGPKAFTWEELREYTVDDEDSFQKGRLWAVFGEKETLKRSPNLFKHVFYPLLAGGPPRVDIECIGRANDGGWLLWHGFDENRERDYHESEDEITEKEFMQLYKNQESSEFLHSFRSSHLHRRSSDDSGCVSSDDQHNEKYFQTHPPQRKTSLLIV